MDYSKYITRGRAVSAFAAAAVEDDQPVPAVPVLRMGEPGADSLRSPTRVRAGVAAEDAV